MELYKQDLGKVCLTMNGEFDPTISYEELCCVYVEDDSTLRSFISIKPVPAGSDIYDREYWHPICYGGGMNSYFEADGSYELKRGPMKFEAGTPPIAEVIGLGEAIKYLIKLIMD